MRKVKILINILICFIVTFNILFEPTSIVSYAADGTPGDQWDKIVHDGGKATNIGLCNWMMYKYKIGYPYVYGGSYEFNSSASDCSGTIVQYRLIAGDRCAFKSSSISAGLPIGSSYSIPRIHGLGLISAGGGHVGVYISSTITLTKSNSGSGANKGIVVTGNELDNSCESIGMHLGMLNNSSLAGGTWVYLVGVHYPKKGFVKFDGKTYYYEPTAGKNYSEYVVNCSRTVNGKKYTFDEYGACKQNVSNSILNKTEWIDGGTYSGSTGDVDFSNSNSNSNNSTAEEDDDEEESKSARNTDDYAEVSIEEVSRLEASRELKFEEERRIDDLNYRIDAYKNNETWNNIYIIISCCGIGVLIYTLLLVLVYYVDIFNSLTEVSILHKITFGRMYPIGNENNIDDLNLEENKGIVYMTNKKIIITFITGVLLSAILLNSRFIVYKFIQLSNWFESLIKNMGG